MTFFLMYFDYMVVLGAITYIYHSAFLLLSNVLMIFVQAYYAVKFMRQNSKLQKLILSAGGGQKSNQTLVRMSTW